MPILRLVRHARPTVAPGLCYGRLDVEADAADTRTAAAALADTLPPDCRIVSSPRQRCVKLAMALMQLRPDLVTTHDPRIAEMDFGDWEGRNWSDLGAGAIDAWMADFAHFAPGGGETVTAFMARVGSALDAVESDRTLWITHAGVIRAAALIARGVREPKSTEWPSADIGFGSCTELSLPARSALRGLSD